MNEPLEVVVRKATFPRDTDPSAQYTAEQPTSRQEQGKPTLRHGAMNALLINTGRQIVTEGIKQYAEMTGNYVIAETAEILGTLGADAAIAIKGGPVGIGYVTFKYGMQITTSALGNIRAQRAHEFMLQRTGNTALGESRYRR